MDTALRCAHCGAPARGTRFCTTCGAPLAGAAVGDAAPTDATRTAVIDSLAVPSSPEAQEQESAAVQSTATSVLPTPQPTSDGPAPPWLGRQPAARPLRGKPNVFALLVVGALALSGWAIVRGVEEHTLSGTVLLIDSRFDGLGPGTTCAGEGGYGDLDAGAQVILADDRGETMSTGRLSAGEFDGLGCVFSFAFEDVTRSDFYRLSVAGGQRGQLQYSYKELADADWSLQLSIGDD